MISWQLARRQHFPGVELRGDVDVVISAQIMNDGGDQLYNLHKALGVHHHLPLQLQLPDPSFSYFSSSFIQLQHLTRIQRVGSIDQMASAAKSALICMVLLATVMAVYGNKVSCKNETPLDIKVNDIDIAAGLTAVVNVTPEALGLVLKLVDSLGKEITGSYNCPVGVTEVVLTKAVDGIQLKVGGVTTAVTNLLGGLVNALLGLVLGLLKCAV